MNEESKSAAQGQPAATSASSSSGLGASGSPAQAVRKSRLVGKPLTAKQQQVADMKAEGKSNVQIGSALGISPNVVAKYWTVVNKKLGSTKTKGEKTGLGNSSEMKNPERFAAVIDAATEPEAKLASIAKVFRDYGLPQAASDALLRRVRQKYFGIVEATKSLKSAEIVDALNNKIDLALRYMDDKTMAEASFRDLALGTTAMIEKRQLLRGEPTAIVSDAERKKLHELAPLLLAEMNRRGLTVDGQVTEKTVEPA